MSIISLKRYLWLIYLGLIAVGVYIGTDLFWAVVSARLDPGGRSPMAMRSAAPEAPERRPFQQYAVIQERNLFGGRGRATAPPPPRAAAPAKPPTSQPINLKLVGTVVGSGDHTYAVIEDLGTKKQELYRLGDLIKEAKLVEIARNRVVLEHRGRREELLSFEKPDAAPPPPSGPPARGGGIVRQLEPPPPVQEAREEEPQDEPEDVVADVEQVGENLWRLSRDGLVEQLENLGQFMKEARLTPHFTAGQPDGFMLSSLPPNSLLARMGLRNGDIMKGVNGQTFTSLEDVLQIYQQLQTEPVLQLEIVRGNRPQTLTYEIR
jgi:general secretion pathway protein C